MTTKTADNRILAKGTYCPGKIDYNGSGRKNCRVTIDWELKETEKGATFSAIGNVWNPRETHCYSCGQNLDTIAIYFGGNKKVQRIVEIWQRWHMNDMKAGCTHQRAERWDERPIDPTKPTNAYISLTRDGESRPYYSGWNMLAWAKRSEHPQGLLGEPCEVCGYRYGTAWLHDEIPAEIIAEIKNW